jgi:SAM-dependent methyltransferase
MTNICRICGNAEKNLIHKTREMMFGTRDEFVYLECGRCGTLQIVEIPDLSRYYPKDYYSLTAGENFLGKSLRRRVAARLTGKYFLHKRGFAGKIVAAREKWLDFYFPNSLKEPLLKLNFRSKILDFGCGSGNLLQNLYHFGFRNLTGADAFIEKDIFYPNGVKIYKRPLSEIKNSFDLVMLHHSFEHLPNPLESLREIYELLPQGKFCLIRIPLANFAWQKYGVNWVQLDPPRHLFLFTEKSFRDLAEKAGFAVEKVVYDSESFQFFGSEQYLRDIAMNDERAFRGNVAESIFTPEQLREWEQAAEVLNKESKGDQACFYLRKV